VRASLELPDDFPPQLRDLAARITVSGRTPWDRAVALQEYFTGGDFEYTLDVRIGDDTDAMVQFLETRRGFCQQFAATYAALARAAGLPSRVVVGFTPGTRATPDGDYVVRGRDAHAWVEVWFAGLGWRTFEPTPAGSLPGQAVDTVVDAPASATAPTTPTTVASSATTAPGTTSDTGAVAPREDSRISTSTGGDDGGTDLRTVALVLLGGAVLTVVVVRIGAWLLRPRRRRRRRRAAPTSASRIAGAWREALDTCRAAGHPVSDALTPAEQARSLRRHGLPDDAAPALEELAELYADAEYAPGTPPADAEREAWAAVGTIRRTLVDEQGPRERLRHAARAGRS
jgi:hypothetical protein